MWRRMLMSYEREIGDKDKKCVNNTEGNRDRLQIPIIICIIYQFRKGTELASLRSHLMI